MSTIFAKIILGEIPCHCLAEDDRFLSFLDVRPVARGHALVIPKQEVDRFFDMDDDLLSDVLRFAKPVAEAIESVVPCKRVGLMVAGLEVPHAHLHLVPINQIGDLNFDNAAPTDGDVLAALAADIRAAISA
jgi:histidine triad (HIT) family protein